MRFSCRRVVWVSTVDNRVALVVVRSVLNIRRSLLWIHNVFYALRFLGWRDGCLRVTAKVFQVAPVVTWVIAADKIVKCYCLQPLVKST